jgi:hypothetical protein
MVSYLPVSAWLYQGGWDFLPAPFGVMGATSGGILGDTWRGAVRVVGVLEAVL